MIRVRTVLTGWPGSPGLNTFYFDENTNPPEDVAAEAFTRVHDFWDDVVPLFPSTFTATVDQLVDQLDSTTGSLTASFAQAGPNVSIGTVAGGEFLPAQTMGVLSLRTGDTINGERVNGRSYIGPMAEVSNNADGQMINTAISTLALAGIALKADLPGGGWLGVWHRPTPPGGTDGSLHAVIDTVVRPVWGHLKSRRR